jgi:hypothetical protein
MTASCKAGFNPRDIPNELLPQATAASTLRIHGNSFARLLHPFDSDAVARLESLLDDPHLLDAATDFHRQDARPSDQGRTGRMEFNRTTGDGSVASRAPNSVEGSEHNQHQRSPNYDNKLQANVARTRTVLTRSHPRIAVE